MTQKLIDAIIEMREDDALTITNELLDGDTTSLEILDACRKAMDVIGKQFEAGESFIPELIMAGEVLAGISAIVRSRMTEETEVEKLGKIIIGTVEGDIHDVAKDIVVFMLDINGFDVTDLGVDVPPAKFVESVKETGAKIVGLSGFLTLAYDPMKFTIEALNKEGLDVKVMIGGGQIDDNIQDYTGADAWGKDAMAAVTIAKEWLGDSNG